MVPAIRITNIAANDLPARIALVTVRFVPPGEVYRRIPGFTEQKAVEIFTILSKAGIPDRAVASRDLAPVVDAIRLGENRSGRINYRDITPDEQEAMPYQFTGKNVIPHNVTAGIYPESLGAASSGDVERGELPCRASHITMQLAAAVAVRPYNCAVCIHIVAIGVHRLWEIDRRKVPIVMVLSDSHAI